jgi:hypothetical protein
LLDNGIHESGRRVTPNCDVKANIDTDGLPKDREELQGELHRSMRKLANLPARIASYFEPKYIAYAAVPELNPT